MFCLTLRHYAAREEPATPAPSQPAGARETGLKKAQDWWDSQYPARSEGQYPTVPHALNDYAAQQTAAKDADEPTPQEIIAAYDRAIKDKEAAERERDSLREANARLAADLNAALKAGKESHGA